MIESKNIEMIKTVAEGLNYLNKEFIYVGGAVAELYVDSPVANEIRVTDDVDLVVEISSRSNFHSFEKKLRNLGFKNDMSVEAPICRWLFKGIKVDFMPSDESVLGFSNMWYEMGFEKKESITLSNCIQINILPLIIYIATKIDAVFSRGINDLRVSHDFEDVIYIISNTYKLEELFDLADPTLKLFLSKKFKTLKTMNIFEEAIYCNLSYDSNENDFKKILKKIDWICNH